METSPETIEGLVKFSQVCYAVAVDVHQIISPLVIELVSMICSTIPKIISQSA